MKKITSIILLLIFTLTFTVNMKLSFQQETPLIYVEPSIVTGLSPCENFTVAVNLANVTPMYGLDLRFRWDPTILEYVSHVAKIPVETHTGGVLHQPTIMLMDEVDDVAGTYWLAATSLFPAPAFTGNGTFFEMTFHVIGVGVCDLEIFTSDLADDQSPPSSIPHDIENGLFSNFVPKTARLEVDPKNVIDAGLTPCHNFTVDVDIENLAELEDVEFWLGYDTSILDVVGVTPSAALSATVDVFELEGKMRFNATASPSLNGDLTLANVTFHVEDTGETVIDLYNITLVDRFGGSISYEEPTDGFFSNILKAKLFVDPPELIDPTLTPGEVFEIDVKIENVFDFYGVRFNLSYNTYVLTCLGAIIFPPNNESYISTDINMDDLAGYIAVNLTFLSPATPVTILPPTTIVRIFFQVQNFGCSVLDLHDTNIIDQTGTPITHEVGDGFFCTLVADVAVISVEPEKNMTYGGNVCSHFINVTVIVENLGDTLETFDVTTYYVDTLNVSSIIGTQTVFNLPPTHNRTIEMVWNTTGTTTCSNYTIRAVASPVPYELNLTNNALDNGWVFIKITGDINGDGTVNILDVVSASAAYYTCEGDPGWNPEADIAPPCGCIDIYDITTIAARYGQSCS